MSKNDFLFLEKDEIYDLVESRLLSNGYGIYTIKNIIKATGAITLIHESCGTTLKTNLQDIEDGAIPQECPHCLQKIKEEKLAAQRHISEVISDHHLELISINEDDYYIKCQRCGNKYYLGTDFYHDSDPYKMYCKNLPCVIHALFHDDDICDNKDNDFDVEIIDDGEYYPHNFVEDVYDTLRYENGYLKINRQNKSKYSILKFDKYLEFCNEDYYSYECEDYQTGIYDEMNDSVEIICKKCGNIYNVSCEQYHEEDFECSVCKIIEKKVENQKEQDEIKFNKKIEQLQLIIDELKSESKNSLILSNKNKCNILKSICKELAKHNGIIYLSADCPTPNYCAVECPVYTATIRYLENEITEKAKKHKKISLSFLTPNIDINPSTEPLELHEKICALMHTYNKSQIKNNHFLTSEEQEKILKMPIEELYLSKRAYNPLKRHGIKYVNSLVNMNSSDYANVRGLGYAATQEISHKLFLLGLNPIDNICMDTNYTIVYECSYDEINNSDILHFSCEKDAKTAAQRIKDFQRRIAQEKGYTIFEDSEISFDAGDFANYRNNHIKYCIKPYDVDRPHLNTFNNHYENFSDHNLFIIPIEYLELSYNTYKILKYNKIHTIQDLIKYSQYDIMKIRHFNKKSLEEVKTKLKTFDFALKDTD